MIKCECAGGHIYIYIYMYANQSTEELGLVCTLIWRGKRAAIIIISIANRYSEGRVHQVCSSLCCCICRALIVLFVLIVRVSVGVCVCVMCSEMCECVRVCKCNSRVDPCAVWVMILMLRMINNIYFFYYEKPFEKEYTHTQIVQQFRISKIV